MLLTTLGLATTWAMPALALAPQKQPRFSAQQVVYKDSSAKPSSLVVGDLDGDGRDDVIVPMHDGQLHVFLAYPSGGLQGPRIVDLGNVASYPLELGDIDEDGKLDLAAYIDGQHSWAAGDGAGGFGTPQSIGPAPGGIDLLVDMDLDGHLDVLSVSTSAVQVLLGDGSGQFTTQTPVAIVGAGSPTVGDLDGDGLPDVLVAIPNAQYATLINMGGGFLAMAATVATPVYSTSDLELGDLDQDGDLDLVAAGKADFAVFLGNGDGSFQAGTLTDEGGVWSVVLSDWNGDGRLDLVLGDDSGGYGPSHLRWAAGDGAGGFGPLRALPTGNVSGVRAVADLNGDGRLDLVAGQSGGFYSPESGYSDPFDALTVLLGDGAGGVRARRESADLPAGASLAYSWHAWKVRGDVNGDGIVDLLRVDADQPLAQIRLGDGAGLFGGLIDVPLPFQADGVHLGDVGGDGLDDLVCVGINGSSLDVVTLTGDGAGNFTGPVTGTVPGTQSVALVDFDGDGRMDLAEVGTGGQFFLALGQASGSFVAQTPIRGFDSIGSADHFADIDGDGALDVLAGPVNVQFQEEARYSIGFGNGSGGFTSISNRTIPYSVHSSALGDIDGDGDPDLALGRTTEIFLTYNDVVVLENVGGGQFGQGRRIEVGVKPEVLEIADLDDDGMGDVMLRTDSGSLVWLSFGPPKHVLKPEFVVSRRYHGLGVDTPIGVGHANLDGRLDVITRFGLRPAVYINQGP